MSPTSQPTPPRSSRASSPEKTPSRGTRLDVKRVDKACIQGEWKIFENDKPAFGNGDNQYENYAEYAVILRRKMQHVLGRADPEITLRVLIQNEDILKVAMEVMKDLRKVSWNLRPCKLDPELLVVYLPQFRKYLAQCLMKATSADEERTAASLSLLIGILETEYATTLTKVDSVTSNEEITFDLLWSIFPPRSLLYTTCAITSEPRVVRLLEFYRDFDENGVPCWGMLCEYIEAFSESESPSGRFGLKNVQLYIHNFTGVLKITTLKAYPLKWHPKAEEIREGLINRGRQWADLNGAHHLHYDGLGYKREWRYPKIINKVKVFGRVMIDRGTFLDVNPNYPDMDVPNAAVSDASSRIIPDRESLRDEDLLIASPILHGFSLVDKLWLEFKVSCVRPIQWNNDVFDRVTIDPEYKFLVRSLVESHSQGRSFDDFVEGKGMGLVFNLFGPPGVGKSLTVEATSEHLHKPFYVVGGGDLGTDARTLDYNLNKIFQSAAKWKAVVLIDEADVFLEARRSDHLERNAMVAVFLRQIEYFRGILFLTTNRVTTFDPAFQSRIHLSLEYKDLSASAKAEIWQAFLAKARGSSFGAQSLTADQIKELSTKKINGRQIKNVVKLAVALSETEKQPLGFEHLVKVMDLMERSILQ